MSEKQSKNINYLVVPDGTAADSRGNAIACPSFIYRQVLDYVMNIIQGNDSVYLAPANDFGCGYHEQDLAYQYLSERKKGLNIICPKTETEKYVDTYGNALYLREFLKDRINDIVFELVCAVYHSYRAEYCFKRLGFNISRVHRVRYKTYNENVVRRLWYYKYKPVHILYEFVAMIKDLIKQR